MVRYYADRGYVSTKRKKVRIFSMRFLHLYSGDLGFNLQQHLFQSRHLEMSQNYLKKQ